MFLDAFSNCPSFATLVQFKAPIAATVAASIAAPSTQAALQASPPQVYSAANVTPEIPLTTQYMYCKY